MPAGTDAAVGIEELMTTWPELSALEDPARAQTVERLSLFQRRALSDLAMYGGFEESWNIHIGRLQPELGGLTIRGLAKKLDDGSFVMEYSKFPDVSVEDEEKEK